MTDITSTEAETKSNDNCDTNMSRQINKLNHGKRQAFSDYDNLFLKVFPTNKDLAREVALKIFKHAVSDDLSFKNEVKKHHDRLVHNFSLIPPVTDRKRIAILGYIVPCVPEWDPDSIKTGIAGSEEAIIYVSKELVNMGIDVTIYANPPKDSMWTLPIAQPRYINANQFTSDDSKYDAVLCWRRFDFQIASTKGPAFFWPHDICGRKLTAEKLSGILFLSKYQRDHYYQWTPEMKSVPYTICGNGIDLSQFSVEKSDSKKSKRKPYSCAYISNYSRGLEILLDIWPQLRKAYPKVTLDVYYGRETFGSCSKEVLDRIIFKLESLIKMGVTEHGKVSHVDLAKALSKISFLTYPCTTLAETYCISVVKAQAAGCIPITTRVGALDETVHPEAPTVPLISGPEDAKKYADLLVATLGLQEKDLNRKKYIDFARKCTWKACTDKMLELIYKPKDIPDNKNVVE